MNTNSTSAVVTRRIIYLAMVVLLIAIFIGAYRDAPPIFLAVAFVGEIILVSTAHLSSVIQQHGLNLPPGRPHT